MPRVQLILSFFILAATLPDTVTSFAPDTMMHRSTTSLEVSRRGFVEASSLVFLNFGVSPAFAEDVDDLAMPTEDEAKKAAVSISIIPSSSCTFSALT